MAVVVVVVGLLIIGTQVADAAPAWCNVEGLKNKVGGASDSVNDAMNKEWNPALVAVVKTTCFPDAEANQRKKDVDAARASWSQKLGLTDDDWRDVATWAVEAQVLQLYDHQLKFDSYDEKYAWSKLTPMQQLTGMIHGIPNATAKTTYADYVYVADALGPKLSELGRLGVILSCSRTDNSVVELALCEADIKAFDRKKAFEEIRADKATTATARMMARLLIVELDKNLAAYDAAVKKWKAKDPAYAQMFDIAAKTRREWVDTHWKQQTALLDLALAMDDARQTKSRKLLDGCSDKTWAAWKAEVAKIPASKFVGFSTEMPDYWLEPAMAVVTSTVPGYLASVALYSCHKADENKEPVIGMLGSVMAYTPGLRGPRLHSHWAILSADLKLDDASEKIKYPLVRHDTSSRFYGNQQYGSMGTIAKVGKPNAQGMAEVTFAKKIEKRERCQKSKMTNRISHLTSNGTIIYFNDCLKWGVDAIDQTPDPELVHARYLDGLKPGMNVYFTQGAVLAAWPKGNKTPAVVAGVPLK